MSNVFSQSLQQRCGKSPDRSDLELEAAAEDENLLIRSAVFVICACAEAGKVLLLLSVGGVSNPNSRSGL